MLVTCVCRFGDSLVATLRLSSGKNVIFNIRLIDPHGLNLKESTIIHTDTSTVNFCAHEKGYISLHEPPENVNWMRYCTYLIIKWCCAVTPSPLNFVVKSWYGTIFWGKMQVTKAICILFNCSKAAFYYGLYYKHFYACKILFIVSTRYHQESYSDTGKKTAMSYTNFDF